MIAFQIAVERDLPVRAFDRSRAQEGPVAEVERLEVLQIAPEITVEVDRRIGRQADEDYACPLLARQFGQAALGLVHVAERACLRDSDQPAALTAGPAVL